MIHRLLIANRGEIAVRIMRGCRELNIETVAVYSEADRRSPHVSSADVAVCIGPPPATSSYLSISNLLEVARTSGADAVHPGYGFLAESADFAKACEDAGLIFIGPPSSVIRRMGVKTEARRLMQQAGIPVIPGAVPASQPDLAAFEVAAQSVGFPLLLKAASGGGGKGMRIVREIAALSEAVEAARREAVSAFGDGTLYVERLLEEPRHIEIQVFSDNHGNSLHLFERECSIQRRHQKIVEESPAPGLSPRLRARMCEAAVEAARATEYRNAGTVEFLVDGDDGAFYFLEMNTRLQVEHPVTEAVVGVDLVHAQLRAASGERLPWRQKELVQRGHAIECRIYAEDPATNFLPQSGDIRLYREPRGPGIRVDSGIAQGSHVPVHYDPLLAKVIVAAENRQTAVTRAHGAIQEYVILGLRTNVTFLHRLLGNERYRSARIDTAFLDREMASLLSLDEPGPAAILAAGLHLQAKARGGGPVERSGRSQSADPWNQTNSWRLPGYEH